MWCSLVIVPLLALPMVATPATDPAGAAAKQVEMPPKRQSEKSLPQTFLF